MTKLDYTIQLDTIQSGFDGTDCWVHSRAGAIPGETPTVVMTLQKLLLKGSDVFGPLHDLRTKDMGRQWAGPTNHEGSFVWRTDPTGMVGNFGVVHVTEQETWVTVCEWMQPAGCKAYGSDNRVFASRIKWNLPNGYAVR